MDTPICDFVRAYRHSGTLRLHMPGHKGVPLLGCEPLDITEIEGADDLYHPEGIIARSEANAAALFGAGRTLYSTEGSSQCIRAMLRLALLGYGPREGRARLLAARNVHRAFVSACALLDLDVAWLMPEGDRRSLCSCPVSPEQVDGAIRHERPFAVYLTAPDYLGGSPDLAAIAAVCRAHGVPLLVDNAHGAYLKFLSPSRHPMDLGAAMCCDSAHKTLPVLTGGAYLHLSREAEAQVGRWAKSAMALFGSSSPSYLILQSLDLCNRYLSEDYPGRLAAFLPQVEQLREQLSRAGWQVLPSDPLKIVLSGCRRGYTGTELAALLRQADIECEFADLDAVVLMVTPENLPEVRKLAWWADLDLPPRAPLPELSLPRLPAPRRRMTIRQGAFARSERVPAAQALGRVCADLTVSCPPAVPIAVSGEEITPEVLRLFAAYDLDTVSVVEEG